MLGLHGLGAIHNIIEVIEAGELRAVKALIVNGGA